MSAPFVTSTLLRAATAMTSTNRVSACRRPLLGGLLVATLSLAAGDAAARTSANSFNTSLQVTQVCVATLIVNKVVLRMLCQPGNIVINLGTGGGGLLGALSPTTSSTTTTNSAGVPTIVY